MAEVKASKFKPKMSSNIIEGVTPATEAEVTMTPDKEEEVNTIPEEDVVADLAEETAEKAEEKVEEAPTVTFEDIKAKQPVEKNVKIRLKMKHSCFIGGVSYHFEKGKQYNVPTNVKTILMQADLLMPL